MKSTWFLIVACAVHIAGACDGHHEDDESQQAEFRTNHRVDSYDPYEFVNPFLVPYYFGRQNSPVQASGEDFSIV